MKKASTRFLRYFSSAILITIISLLSGCSLISTVGGLIQATPIVQSDYPPTMGSEIEDVSIPSKETQPIHQTESPISTSKQSTTRLVVTASIPTSTLTPTSTSNNHPNVVASDLLFISDNRLIRWDHITHYGVVLAEDVIEYSVSENGKNVALLRSRGITANGKELFDVDLLNLKTKQKHPFLSEIPGIKGVALSPDGNWLAFFQTDLKQVRGVQLSNPESIITLGVIDTFDDHCTSPLWSPDSQSVLWCDQEKIWVDHVNINKKELLADRKVQILDPKSQPIDVNATFGDIRWSPAGRFALVRVFPEGTNVQWQAVLDTRTKRMVQILDSFCENDQDTSLTWLQNGDLAVVGSAKGQTDIPPAIKIWRVIPTNTEMLVSKLRISIDLKLFVDHPLLKEFLNKKDSRIEVESLQPIATSHLFIGARDIVKIQSWAILDLNLDNGTITPVLTLLSDIVGVIWSPEGNGLITQSLNGQVQYISIAAGETFELTPYSNTKINMFTWLAPELRR